MNDNDKPRPWTPPYAKLLSLPYKQRLAVMDRLIKDLERRIHQEIREFNEYERNRDRGS